MIKSASIRTAISLYTDVSNIRSNPKGRKKDPMAIHRCPAPWNEGLNSLSLSDMVDSTPTVIADDPSAGVAIAVARYKQGLAPNATLVTSDPSLSSSTSFFQVEQMNSQCDVNTIQMTNNRFQDFNFIGNNAFSITKPILQMIVDNPPPKTRLVTQSDGVCFAPDHQTTKTWVKIFNGLKEKTGLKKVYYLRDRFFTQYNADGSKGKEAQEITVVLHCERGYDGPIEVYDKNEQLIYIADRLAEFLPRTIEARNISLLPTIGQCWTGKPNVWHNKGGYSKANEAQARVDCKKYMYEKDVRIVIPHGNGGTPGKPETWWADERLGLHTVTAEALDPGQFLPMQRVVMGFGLDTVANRATRDSVLSLMKTQYFAKAYQCMAPPAFGGPALEYLLKKFPADRIWDQQEVENYVRSNTPA